MPDRIPMHYNIYGEPDRWGGKNDLMSIMIIIPILTYLMFLAAIYIDPKKRISEMGNKYHHLRFIMTVIIAMIFILIVYINVHSISNFKNYISIILGLLFILLGNYFRSLKPNYFIGIRTPWTLESETVWRRTHHIGSIIWFIGGFLIILVNIISRLQPIAWIISLGIILLLILIPVIHSYSIYKKLQPKS
ncbi:SdpI family protein [Aquimarina sp. MMG016]|uniref:SdpI family protein n=1 Tax=Aquimarina sp. MMG016 TaxID=2822690 RepID=UPI001FFD7F21|nr:SdpI family protein [Aquimarina sp. MMG016]